jgi:hypothetical protein
MIHIQSAAALIAQLDKPLAALFLSSPFQRHNIVTAFHASLAKSKFAAIADEIAVALRYAVDVENAKVTN